MMLKNNKGISLVTMVMTVLIMLILLSTLTYTAYTNIRIRGLNKLYNDIRTLNDEVAVYYLENGRLPVGEEYATISVGDELDETISFVTKDGTFTNQDSLVNPNDYNDESGVGQATYYTIDLGLFDNISLENDGQYIINEQSHMIYYVPGITLDGVTYNTLPLDYKDTEYNIKHPVNSVTVRNVYLPMGGVSLNLEDYMTFTASDGNVAVPREITYSVTTAGYQDYFSINDGIITSATDIDATSTTYSITATISSYGVTTTKTATLRVYLTDIELLDSTATNEISTLNMIRGESIDIFTRKYGNAGTLRLIAKVEDGNGIDASVSNTVDSETGCYPISITATNTGEVFLTVIENNGRAAKELEINVFEPSLSSSNVSITSLNSTRSIEFTIDERYEEEPDRFEIIWSSSDTSIINIESSEENPLEATVSPVSFGRTTVYCEVRVDGATLTTLESNVSVTGVSIDNLQMTVGERATPNYVIDSNIAETTISDISITSSNTTVLDVTENSTTGEAEFVALSAGTSTVTVTVELVGGTTYTDSCTVTISS